MAKKLDPAKELTTWEDIANESEEVHQIMQEKMSAGDGFEN